MTTPNPLDEILARWAADAERRERNKQRSRYAFAMAVLDKAKADLDRAEFDWFFGPDKLNPRWQHLYVRIQRTNHALHMIRVGTPTAADVAKARDYRAKEMAQRAQDAVGNARWQDRQRMLMEAAI